jgi:hypothetical protein
VTVPTLNRMKREDEEERRYRQHRRKCGLRFVAILDGSYKFDPVVSEEQRAWWREIAKHYLSGIIKHYAY